MMCGVLRCRPPAPDCAFHGARPEAVSVPSKKQLRGEAQQVLVPCVDEGPVGHGLCDSEPRVQGSRRSLHGRRYRVGEIDLVHFSCAYLALGVRNAGTVRVPR